MAYDRYDTRRDRWQDERGGREDRGFFERAGDEIASWFGDDEAERRRRQDERMNHDYDRGYGRDADRDRYAYRGSGRDRDRNRSGYEPMNWTSSDRDYRYSRPRSDRDYGRTGYGERHDFSPRGSGYGPSVTDYRPGYSERAGYSGGYGYGYGGGESYGSGGWGGRFGRGDERRDDEWERDDYRNTSYAGSARPDDRHYDAWRQRQLNELDRDYDQYCRERQERFESDFGAWRENRMNQRQRLGGIREHMDVVGSDGETIGKVDCVRGDHIVLTKSDSPDNRHHMIDCSMIETVEGDQVRLDVSSEEAKNRWEDAENRGFFGRGDEETNLERSFSGTYES